MIFFRLSNFCNFLNKLILLLFFQAFVSTASAQNDVHLLIDQLKKSQSKTNFSSDTASVIILNKLANGVRSNSPDSSLIYCRQALNLAVKQKYIDGEIRSLNNISKAHYILGSFDSSLIAATRALNLSKETNNRRGMSAAITSIGLIHLSQDKYEVAKNEFLKALNMSIDLRDSSDMVVNYFNVGLCYDELKKSDKAFFYLNKALSISKQINNQRMITMTYNRLGETYFHSDDYSNALIHYQKALDQTYRDNWESSFAYSGLGITFFNLGQYKLAIENGKKGFDYALKMNAKWDIVRALKVLSEAYVKVDDYKSAYEYQKLYKQYSDSIYNENKEKEINYLHLKEQEIENIQLQKENEIDQQAIRLNRLIIIIISLIGLSIIVFSVVVFRNNTQKTSLNSALEEKNRGIDHQNKQISIQKEALEDLNHTKNQLFSIISHDLRSPLISILQALELLKDGDITLEEQKEMFSAFHHEVSLNMSMLDNLLRWAANQQMGINADYTTIDVTRVVDEIVNLSNFMADDKSISITHDYTDSVWVLADKDHVKISMQNLIGNAIKFTPRKGKIKIFYSETDVYQGIHVKDSGIGISPEKLNKLFKVIGKKITENGTDNEMGTGIGLMLIKDFTEGNGGTIEVKSKLNEGTEFTIYLKKPTVIPSPSTNYTFRSQV